MCLKDSPDLYLNLRHLAHPSIQVSYIIHYTIGAYVLIDKGIYSRAQQQQDIYTADY